MNHCHLTICQLSQAAVDVMNHESKAKNVFWSEARLAYAQVIQPLIEEEQQ